MDLIQTTLADPGVRNGILFCIAAVAGQVISGLKKWADGEEWMFVNLRRTVAAALGNAGAMVTALATTGVDNLTLVQVIAAGITLGLSMDNLLNRGTRKTWTDEQREAAK